MDILKKRFPEKEVHSGIYFVMKGEMVWTEEWKTEVIINQIL